MPGLDEELADPVSACVNALGDDEFLAVLKKALTGSLEEDDLSPAHGFCCFWGEAAVSIGDLL